MRPEILDELGEEPIYCEAYHEDVAYSGSEDDYYEAPEDRRLRIETQAVQFLTGNVPYLLSANLQGPFDNKSWNNPWKSKRAQREARRRRSHSSRALKDVEVPRGNGSSKVTDDLPSTQRTSLYPLPSPETTNPPSARKNAFMEQSEYSRIKTWREAVTSIPVTTDPFWASRHSDSQDARATRKRHADGDWLHTRGSKKQRPIDRRNTESPSQAAARTRKSHGRPSQNSRPSQNMTQSAPVFFSREDALAARRDAQSASLDSSRLANVLTATPDLPQTLRHSQSSERQLPGREPELSEDELSMPSTTGPTEAPQFSGQKSTSPTSLRRSLARQNRAADGNSASRSSSRKLYEKMAEQAQDSYRPVSQCSGMDMAKSCAKDAARRVLEASQQDESFYFHAKPRNPAERPEAYQSLTRPMDGTILGPSSAQMRAPASTECVTGEGEGPQPEDGEGPVVSQTENRIDSVNNDGHDTPYRPFASPGLAVEAEAGFLDGPGSVPEATATPQIKETRTEDIIQGNRDLDVAERLQHHDDETCAKPDIDRSTFVCTQELSPVSMHGSAPPAGSVVVSEDAALQRTPSADDKGTSTSEWSTYINTQDLSNASEKSLSSHVDEANGMQFVSYDPDDPADPDWTTFVDAQCSMAESAGTGKAAGEVDEAEIFEEGSDDPSDPEWSTIVSTQDQFAARKQRNEGREDKRGDAMDIDVDEQGDEELLVQDDIESDSDWSTYMSASSQITVDQTGNTSHEPAHAEVTAAEDVALKDAASEAKSSQVSVGAIIDAYAKESQLSSEEIEDDIEGNAATEDRPNSVVVLTGQKDDEVPESEMQPRQASCESTENQDGTAVSVFARLISDEQAVLQPSPVEENSSIHMNETTASGSIMPTQTRATSNEETGHVLQSPSSHFQGGMEVRVDTDAAHGTPASVEPRHVQSPWHQEGNTVLRTPATRLKNLSILDETNDSVEKTPLQSPWVKGSVGPPVRAVLDNETTLNKSSSNLTMLADEALTLSEAPQTPWVGDKLPSPNFSLSVKRFSDFMKPSPTKKRASANGSILRGSGMSSRVLFGTPVPLEPRRRVTFAPLAGEEEAGLADIGSDDKGEVYVEEDVSYFDTKGKKTSSVRVARPTGRAVSPPPLQINVADAGELPDHDHNKFAKHFKVMSKRKRKLHRRIPRLLPSDSQQQTGASQEVGAMAEAFIEASQTRKRAAELAGASVGRDSQSDDTPALKDLSPVAINPFTEQENIEPVDDVSAVLDNLSDFLDNTWGIDMSMDMNKDLEAEVETPAKQQTKTASSRFDNVGDPLLSLNVNIWSD